MSGPSRNDSTSGMAEVHGRGPDGSTCSQCTHLRALPRICRPQGFNFSCSKWDVPRQPRNHRSSWPACGLFVKSKTGRPIPAPSQLIEIACPQCGVKRTVNRNFVEAHPDYDRRCGNCSKEARDTLEAPIFNGCRPVEARDGKRCLQSYDCPHYNECLDYAAVLLWPGFRGSKDPKPVPMIETTKRAYQRRVSA